MESNSGVDARVSNAIDVCIGLVLLAGFVYLLRPR